MCPYLFPLVEKPLGIETPQPPDKEEDIFTGPNI